MEKKRALKGILRLWKPRLVNWSHSTSLSPAAVDQRDHLSVFFFNKLPAPLDVRSKKSPFFSQKSIEILFSTATLTNFYLASSWQSLLTSIWFSSLTISHWFFIRVILLNSGSEKHYAEDKKTAGIFEICFLSKKIRTTNIGKGWPNKNHEKISGQKLNFVWKRKFWKEYCQTHFVEIFSKRVDDGMKKI